MNEPFIVITKTNNYIVYIVKVNLLNNTTLHKTFQFELLVLPLFITLHFISISLSAQLSSNFIRFMGKFPQSSPMLAYSVSIDGDTVSSSEFLTGRT